MKAEYIDHLGTDLTVVNAARVSFDKESEWEEIWETESRGDITYNKSLTKVLNEKDTRLINYLAKHGHWTPFSHVIIQMRETIPIFVARQRFKHFVGFNTSGENDHEGLGTSFNETSRRYVDDTPEFYFPDKWRKRAENKKQGSSEEEITWISNDEWEGYIKDDYDKIVDDITTFYKCMIDSGVAPEQARMILPQSMYTSYYVTGSLAAWARAYKQRIDGHAQLEIQELGKQWDNIISNIPELAVSWKTLKEA